MLISVSLYHNNKNKKLKVMKTQEIITNLKNEVNEANTATVEGRQIVADNCKELYMTIEAGLFAKYGEDAVKDAYKDLYIGNFAEPFMCEQKKTKFLSYSNIYLSKIAQ